MYVRGWRSGTSIEVPVCRAYIPVRLKPMLKRIKRLKKEWNKIKEKEQRENKNHIEGQHEEDQVFIFIKIQFSFYKTVILMEKDLLS